MEEAEAAYRATLAAPEGGGMDALPPMDILEMVEPTAQMKAEVSCQVVGAGWHLFVRGVQPIFSC